MSVFFIKPKSQNSAALDLGLLVELELQTHYLGFRQTGIGVFLLILYRLID